MKSAFRRRRIFPWLFLLLAVAPWQALLATPPRPIRILFFGDVSQPDDANAKLTQFMEGLGRDAIYFDVISNAADLNPGFLSHFDAAILAAPATLPQALSEMKAEGRVLNFGDLSNARTAREII